MRPGDLIVSSNWIIHGTFQTETMKTGRTSIEVRYIGDKREVAPYKPKNFLSKIEDRVERMIAS